MKRFIVVASGVLLVLAVMAGSYSSDAQAASRPRLKCESRFDAMDTNKDGKVSLEEFKAVQHLQGDADTIFKSKDTNKDGFLTKQEFCSAKRVRGKSPAK